MNKTFNTHRRFYPLRRRVVKMKPQIRTAPKTMQVVAPQTLIEFRYNTSDSVHSKWEKYRKVLPGLPPLQEARRWDINAVQHAINAEARKAGYLFDVELREGGVRVASFTKI